jgi:hypothetical protein
MDWKTNENDVDNEVASISSPKGKGEDATADSPTINKNFDKTPPDYPYWSKKK